MAALQYLESFCNAPSQLSDWYTTLADLYQRKLWHQLTLKLEQFVALPVFKVLIEFDLIPANFVCFFVVFGLYLCVCACYFFFCLFVKWR